MLLSDFYGQNSIGWGAYYAESHWGNVNETSTSWGLIYPMRAGGSVMTADMTSLLADSTRKTADQTEF